MLLILTVTQDRFRRTQRTRRVKKKQEVHDMHTTKCIRMRLKKAIPMRVCGQTPTWILVRFAF